jgi:hypothetical protein
VSCGRTDDVRRDVVSRGNAIANISVLDGVGPRAISSERDCKFELVFKVNVCKKTRTLRKGERHKGSGQKVCEHYWSLMMVRTGMQKSEGTLLNVFDREGGRKGAKSGTEPVLIYMCSAIADSLIFLGFPVSLVTTDTRTSRGVSTLQHSSTVPADHRVCSSKRNR